MCESFLHICMRREPHHPSHRPLYHSNGWQHFEASALAAESVGWVDGSSFYSLVGRSASCCGLPLSDGAPNCGHLKPVLATRYVCVLLCPNGDEYYFVWILSGNERANAQFFVYISRSAILRPSVHLIYAIYIYIYIHIRWLRKMRQNLQSKYVSGRFSTRTSARFCVVSLEAIYATFSPSSRAFRQATRTLRIAGTRKYIS